MIHSRTIPATRTPHSFIVPRINVSPFAFYNQPEASVAIAIRRGSVLRFVERIAHRVSMRVRSHILEKAPVISLRICSHSRNNEHYTTIHAIFTAIRQG